MSTLAPHPAHPVIALWTGGECVYWCSRCGFRVRGVSLSAGKCVEWNGEFEAAWDQQITERVRREASEFYETTFGRN